jgi:hypothetical protein
MKAVNLVGFEVLKAVTIKTSTPLKAEGTTYCPLHAGFLVCLLFNPEYGGYMSFQNVG